MYRANRIGYFFFPHVGSTFLNYQAKFERDLSTSVFTAAVYSIQLFCVCRIFDFFLQKEHRKEVSKDMISCANNDPTFMKRIITGDESWVYEYDTLTNQQSSEWRFENEPNPKKPRRSRSKVKSC